MMITGSDILQFVDAPSASPNVLLNLNNGNPIYIAGNGFSAPPPRLKRSTLNSAAQDGTNVAQSAYEDRELPLTLGLDTVSPDNAAEAIQDLARLLNSEGQWLMWQPSTIEPVFFRTKRAEIDSLAEFNGIPTDGFREITIRIPAEPFTYGLPVTGSVTIANDPTAGTNRMTYTFPTVQGDVATPLHMKMTQNATTWATLISTTCLPVGSTSGGPVFTGAFDIAGTLTGWSTTTSTADATAVSGFRKRWQRTSGSNLSRDVILTTYLSNVPRGDYRLLVRAQASAVDSTISGWISDPSLSIAASATTKTIPGATYAWVDLGVVRAPLGPRKTVLLDQGHNSRTYVTVRITTPSVGTVDLDELILVPVGLDDASDTRTAIVGGILTGTDDLYVDSVNEQTYMRVASTDTLAPATLVGGFPRVLPNAVCKVNFMRLIGVAGDDKAWTTTVDWTYLPLYLYDRPATT